ncbi:MAG: molybdopterin-dependent oxidoreductase, partial [Anaerolineales bacterium]|nr:molybdopterin-dependent oxidoreductase [Anaerolineales bacterium]
NIQFIADIVYTNLPPAGAYRGYGVPQGYWPVERHMEKIARQLGIAPLDFRLKNALRAGELHPFSTAWSEGREPQPETIETCGLEECVRQGRATINWDEKFNNPNWRHIPDTNYLKRGIGVALVMQGTAIPYLDMGGASIKMNDDGSFNLLIGATDLGTGSDTVLSQMAAEVLGVPIEDIIPYSSDTDFTPFDKGAYASSTTYISGGAVVKAAQQVAERIKLRAAKILNEQSGESRFDADDIRLYNRQALSVDGQSVSLETIARHALHQSDQEQIMGVASFMSPVSPPPFAAQFAEVTVDIETGQVVVDRLLMAVDAGVIVNPITASGQVEGGMAQALGYAVCEEMIYDSKGRARERDLRDYHIFQAHEMPVLETIFVETFEPSHPFGVKAVAEIPMDGVAPAVGNAVRDACGVDVDKIPILPERLWRELKKAV